MPVSRPFYSRFARKRLFYRPISPHVAAPPRDFHAKSAKIIGFHSVGAPCLRVLAIHPQCLSSARKTSIA
ncbi:hypothetical protein BCEN4_1290006 [Burkholderia cenocepacia]|nr:hypothetical protein BCEN4_1290006 [Burkholderia cenocepacia]